MAVGVENRAPLIWLMALCIFNFLLHFFGFSLLTIETYAALEKHIGVEGIVLVRKIPDQVNQLSGFFEYILTIKLQILIWVFAFLFLIIRRVLKILKLIKNLRLEKFQLTLLSSIFPLISTVYVFSGNFFAQWTVEHPPWAFAGMIGLLMMGSLTMLFVCIVEPSSTLDGNV